MLLKTVLKCIDMSVGKPLVEVLGQSDGTHAEIDLDDGSDLGARLGKAAAEDLDRMIISALLTEPTAGGKPDVCTDPVYVRQLEAECERLQAEIDAGKKVQPWFRIPQPSAWMGATITDEAGNDWFPISVQHTRLLTGRPTLEVQLVLEPRKSAPRLKPT